MNRHRELYPKEPGQYYRKSGAVHHCYNEDA